MAEKRATIYDIALRAGVSASTVSRVLNGTAAVSRGKRDSILKAVDEMDYQPNALARGLTNNRTSTIGLMVPDIENPFYAAFVSAVEREAMSGGYSVLLCNTMDTYLPGEQTLEIRYMRMLADKRVDGVILTGGSLEAAAPGEKFGEELARMAEHMPVVLANAPSRDGIPSVRCDKMQGIESMVRHLFNAGFHSMGFIAGRPDIEQSSACATAFLDAARELGVETRPEWIVGDNYTLESGAAAAARVLAQQSRPGALIAINDVVAVGCMHSCLEAGLRIPADIAVAGCDNVALSMYTFPRLTTIDLHIPLVAREAVSKLLLGISGKKAHGVTVIKPDLVIRDSSARI